MMKREKLTFTMTSVHPQLVAVSSKRFSTSSIVPNRSISAGFSKYIGNLKSSQTNKRFQLLLHRITMNNRAKPIKALETRPDKTEHTVENANDNNSTIEDPAALQTPMAMMFVSNQYLKDGRQHSGLYTGTIDVETKLPHGQGTMHYHDCSAYGGSWFYGDWSGFGRLDCPLTKASYQGNFLDNVKNGLFVVSFEDGRQYDGHYSLNVMGKGVMKDDKGTYWGYFDQEGRSHGRGKLLMKDGTEYDGEFVHGKMNGHGRMTYANGSYYLGYFTNGKRDRRGMLVVNECIFYDGAWLDDKPLLHEHIPRRKHIMSIRASDGTRCKRLLGRIPKDLSPCSRYSKQMMVRKRRRKSDVKQ